MTTTLKVSTAVKTFHGRRGPTRVFGSDVDRRKEFTDEEAEARFDESWIDGLGDEVESATSATIESIQSVLPEAKHRFIDHRAEHRIFRYKDQQFIAQILNNELTQLWYVPTMDENPKLLRVVFEKAEDRKNFEKLAVSLGWNAEALGLALVKDFIAKHHRPR